MAWSHGYGDRPTGSLSGAAHPPTYIDPESGDLIQSRRMGVATVERVSLLGNRQPEFLRTRLSADMPQETVS